MKITMKQIDQIAKDVLADHYSGMSESSIKEEMLELIEGQETKIILQALGLEKGWNGDVSIRHSGSFADIAKLLSEQTLHKTSQDIWLQLIGDTKIELTETQKNALRKEYKETYLYIAKQEIKQLAEQHALIDAPELFKTFIEQQDEENK